MGDRGKAAPRCPIYPVWPQFQGLAQGATREQHSVSRVQKSAFGAANHSAHWCADFPHKKGLTLGLLQ